MNHTFSLGAVTGASALLMAVPLLVQISNAASGFTATNSSFSAAQNEDGPDGFDFGYDASDANEKAGTEDAHN